MARSRHASLAGRLTILKLFGGYVQAYAAAGLPLLHTAHGALGILAMRQQVETMIAQVAERAMQAGATVQRTVVWNVLLLNGTLTLKVSIASCRHCPDRWRRWRVPLNCGARSDFVLCGLMDETNSRVSLYLLLSPAQVEKDSLYLRASTLYRYKDCYFLTLEAVFGLSSSNPPEQ